MNSMKKARKNLNHVFLSLLLTLFAFSEAKSQEEGPVAYWSMDEGTDTVIYDKTGNGNNGDIIGAKWVEGKSGSALEFDGVDDYVKVSNFGLVAPRSEITISVWLKLGPAIKNQDLFWFTTAQSDNRITVHFPWDNAIHWQFGSPYNPLSIPLPEGITGVWQHFAFVASSSGNFMKIYRNGDEVASKSGMANLEPSSGDWHIGGRPGSNFNGTIDEVAIYSRALTASEIKALYNKKGVPIMKGDKETTPDEVAKLKASQIYGVHFCDGIRHKKGTKWVEGDLRGFLSGEGKIPVKDWVDAVKSTGFDGVWSSELLSPKHWEWDLVEIARETKARMKQYIGI